MAKVRRDVLARLTQSKTEDGLLVTWGISNNVDETIMVKLRRPDDTVVVHTSLNPGMSWAPSPGSPIIGEVLLEAKLMSTPDPSEKRAFRNA